MKYAYVSEVFELACVILDSRHFTGRYNCYFGLLLCECFVEVTDIEDIGGELGSNWCFDASIENLFMI